MQRTAEDLLSGSKTKSLSAWSVRAYCGRCGLVDGATIAYEPAPSTTAYVPRSRTRVPHVVRERGAAPDGLVRCAIHFRTPPMLATHRVHRRYAVADAPAERPSVGGR